MSLSLRQISYVIDGQATLDRIDLEVPRGSLFALLGPSGCGKTTLLKVIAGLLAPSGGSVLWQDQALDQLPPERRGMTMVFQDLRLFPHLSILDNVAFPLKMAGMDRRSRHREAQAMLAMVQLDGLADRRPHQLSGGQQQRAVLARALVAKPRVLLLDEPFSSLDTPLRAEIRTLVKELHQTIGTTMVLVTHDRQEALGMSDLVAVMAPGRVLQVGTPREIYDHPASLEVARQLISGNVLTGMVRDGVFQGGGLGFPVRDTQSGPVQALIAPDQFILRREPGPFQVRDVEFAGQTMVVTLWSNDTRLVAEVPLNEVPVPGEWVSLAVRDPRVRIFPVA